MYTIYSLKIYGFSFTFFKELLLFVKYEREKEMHTIFFPNFYLNLYLIYNFLRQRNQKK